MPHSVLMCLVNSVDENWHELISWDSSMCMFGLIIFAGVKACSNFGSKSAAAKKFCYWESWKLVTMQENVWKNLHDRKVSFVF